MEHFKQRQPLANVRAGGWNKEDASKPVIRRRPPAAAPADAPAELATDEALRNRSEAPAA
jgi:hypothetical protein